MQRSFKQNGSRRLRRTLVKSQRRAPSSSKGRLCNSNGSASMAITIPGPYFMPEKLFHTMAYGADWNETTAGGFVDWVYRGNSIWDPQFSVGGESAYGEVAMAGIYLYYKVLASKVLVEIGNESADTITCSIVPTALSSSLTDKEDIGSMPRCKYALGNAGGPILRVTNQMATAPMLGMRGYDENGLTGTHGAGDPTNVWYWHVVISNTTAQALSCHVRLRILFTVMEYGLKTSEQ